MLNEPKYFGEGLPYLKPAPLKGKLIVIEGTDCAGRSTQVGLFKNWLEVRGYAVIETGWARSNLMHKSIELAKSGNMMDRMTFSLLYATDFADRLENQIIPALRSGHLVIADRYIYTAFIRDVVRDADPKWIRNVFGFALVPDLVLYLKIDMDTLIPRALESGGINYWEAGMDLHMGQDLFDSFVNYQSRLIAEYDKLAKEFDFQVVDARKPVDEIQENIREKVKEILGKPKK
ncbi:MAG: thymidylate kinase [Candidatus Omnitrophica bacterium CG1_02_46_14]|nr:MAG: thymidylate kinase [Candidatus Omnitrophica bacterium CG1_02_46_14]